jgi:predicted dehydrogenase
MKRREFIRTTAVATFAAATTLKAADVPRIRVGMLGAAHSHALEKFRLLRESAEYEFVGVCEEFEKVREPFAKLNARFISQDELLARAEVIVVESAVRDHARHARLALAAGKHVHVEKPPAATMQEADELVRLAQEKNLLLQTGYMWRFHPGLNRAMEAARRGWLGEVFLVRGQINTQLEARRRIEWAEFSGGAMFELGCHLIDAVVRLLGKPVRVTPHLQQTGSDNLADNCVAVFEFPKAQAIVTSSTLPPNPFAHRFFEILGTNGMARVQPIEPAILSLELTKPAGPYQQGAQNVPLPEYRRYVAEFRELAGAIRENKPLSVPLDMELLVQDAVLRASGMR